MSGYQHAKYAAAFSEFGEPRLLPQCQGWIIKRPIDGSAARDAMGCYPLFCCEDWSKLHLDLKELSGEIVSLAVVPDPFGSYTPEYLQSCFPAVCKPYKEHFVSDLSMPVKKMISGRHSRYARAALREVDVEVCADPSQHLEDWMMCYGKLIGRHHISGVTAFSPTSFAKQFDVPGLVAFRAMYKKSTVGMLLWYVQGDIGFAHLSGYTELGYEMHAAFALFYRSIEHFTGKLHWLHLGANAGVDANSNDGLTRFKRGWSTSTRTAYFCGRIFQPDVYDKLAQAASDPQSGYFPVYRAPAVTRQPAENPTE